METGLTDEQMRRWLKSGLRAVAKGLLSVALAISNLALLGLWIVALVLSVVALGTFFAKSRRASACGTLMFLALVVVAVVLFSPAAY